MASSSLDNEGERDTCIEESADIHVSASCSSPASSTVVYGPVNKNCVLTESVNSAEHGVHGLISAGVGGNTKACETIEYHGWPDLVQHPEAASDGGSNGGGNYGGILLNSAIPGVVGLTNLDYFLNQITESCYNLPTNSLCACFIRLLTKVWSKDREDVVLRPVEFKEVLGKVHSQFQDYRQHDCQEFLALLLGTLHDQLNTASILNKKTEKNSLTVWSPSSSTVSSNNNSNLNRNHQHQSVSAFSHNKQVVSSDLSVSSPKSNVSISSNSSHCSSVTGENTNDDELIRARPLPKEIKSFSLQSESSSTVSIISSSTVTGQQLLNGPKVAIPLPAPPSISQDTLKIPSDRNHVNSLAHSLNNHYNDRYSGLDSLKGGAKLYPAPEDPKPTASSAPTTSTITTTNSRPNNLSTTFINKRSINCTTNCIDATRTSESNDCIDASNPLSTTSKKKKTSLNQSKTVNNENSIYISVSGGAICPESSRQKRLKTCSKTFTKLSDKENNVKNVYIAKADSMKSDEYDDSSPVTDAKEEWKRYLAVNRSIIVDTFQGQFKSTVKCSNCNHISVTFEPFMYLALPLPFALQRQVVLSFFSALDSDLGLQYNCPVRFLINVNKYDKVSKVIQELRKLLQEERKASDLSVISSSTPTPEKSSKERPIVLAEVCENYITKILEDNTYLKYIDDSSKSLYAFELPEPPKSYLSYSQTNSIQSQSLNSPQENFQPSLGQIDSQVTSTPASSTVNNEINEINDADFQRDRTNSFNTFADISPLETEFLNQYFFEQMLSVVSCAVCLDEKPRHQLLIHHACDCHLCDQCLEMTIQHFSCGDKFTCPTCNKHITRSEFVPLVPNSNSTVDKLGLSLLVIPLYFRTADQWNCDEFKLIHHPILLRLPNVIPSMQLYSTVDRFVPFPCPYSLHWADMKGLSCSRCSWGSTCRGCEIARFGDITLQSDEALVVHFDPSFSSEHSLSSLTSSSVSSVSTSINSGTLFIDHRSMRDLRPVKNITLDDCLRAFSSSETLDEDNPWFCPVCNCNQKARKCLTIWKCPTTLMVYLKRFIYHGMTSVKVDDIVEFPIESLNMSPFIHDPLVDNNQLYDLQAYVCHSGSVSSGHYTAFAKHCLELHTDDWYYFNDESVTKQEPSGMDERAYILFYTKSSSAKGGIDLSSATSSWMLKESLTNDTSPQKEVCVSNDESRELLLQLQAETNESSLNMVPTQTLINWDDV